MGRFRVGFRVFLLLGSASPALATTFLLYNTGVDSFFNPLAPSGAIDLHYVVTSDVNPVPSQAVTYFNPAYMPDGTDSNWISVNTNGTDGSTFYDFRLHFTIPVGFNLATAVLTGDF